MYIEMKRRRVPQRLIQHVESKAGVQFAEIPQNSHGRPWRFINRPAAGVAWCNCSTFKWLTALDYIVDGLESAFAENYTDEQWKFTAKHLSEHVQNGLR
jgi:hypothetical protein